MTRTPDVVYVPERRSDGWPLCPVCGEDELGDLQHWDARPFGHLFCYRCYRFYEIAEGSVPPADPEKHPLTNGELVDAVERLRARFR